MTNELNRNALLAALTSAGREAAKGNAAAVVALKAAVALGQTDEDFKLYQKRFVIGYLASANSWTPTQATAWLVDKAIVKRVEKGETATPFQRNYGAARTAWSRVREAAGLAKDKAKATRAPAPADISDAEPATTGLADAIKDVRPVAALADLVATLDSVAVFVRRLANANAKLMIGDEGERVRDAIAAISKACQTAHEAPAPVEAKAPKAPKVVQVAQAA